MSDRDIDLQEQDDDPSSLDDLLTPGSIEVEGDEEDAGATAKATAARDDDDEGDRGGRRYSRNVRRRISRERRRRVAAEQRRDELAGKLTAVEERLSQLGSELQELRATPQRKGDPEVDDSQIRRVRDRLAEAVEQGDTQAQARLQEELVDMRTRQLLHEREQSIREELADIRKQQGQQQGVQQGVQQQPDPVIQRRAAGWLNRRGHRQWYQQPGYEEETSVARELDRELIAEGYDPTEDEYWEVLEERLRDETELFDELELGDSFHGRRGKKKAASRRQTPVAPVKRDTPSGKGGKRRYVITKEDQEVMTQFGLDPDDPDHQIAWVENKEHGGSEDTASRKRA